MNFSDFITNHGKQVNKEHFIHLIQVARTDGKIEPSEMELLHKEGRKFGLTDPEIDIIVQSESDHNYNQPYSLDEKFEHLYNIAEMILSDDIVTDGEIRIFKKFSIEAGITDKLIDKSMDLLFRGIKNNENEETLFKEFRDLILQK